MTGCKHETHQSLLLSISMQFWWALSLQSICRWRRGGRFQEAREQRSPTFLEMNENIFLNHAILSRPINSSWSTRFLEGFHWMPAIQVPKATKNIGSGGGLVLVNTFHSEVNSVFSPASRQRSSLGLISSVPNVCLFDVLCRMFEKCLRWWSTFVLAALWKYRFALQSAGRSARIKYSNVKKTRKFCSILGPRLWNSWGHKITIQLHYESVDDEKVVSCHEQAGQLFSSMQWSRGRLASDSDYFADISTRAPLNNKLNVYETNQMQSKHICMKNNNDQVRRLTSFNHH